jgi:ferric-dicitrate binding protein FerR (iron transport regulator)
VMSEVDYSVLAARVLKRKPVVTRESGLSRDRGIAIIAQAMRESNRAKRRLRWWVSGAVTTAVAATAVLTMPRYFRHSHDTSTSHATTSCSDSPAACAAAAAAAASTAGIDIGHMNGREVVPGGVMQADLGHPARVDFDSGTHIALEGNTMLAYDEGAANHRFSLARGSVHLEVAKLKKGQRFLLNTVDAEVEVRGTVFDVAVLDASNGCEQRTRVSVKEGLVEVRTASELRSLRAGEAWTAECSAVSKRIASPALINSSGSQRSIVRTEPAADMLAQKGNPAPLPETQPEVHSSAASPAGLAAPGDSLPTSDLAKQNDMYARASVERNQGHISEALALYKQLVARYPSSALVESATVQRIRILRQSDRAEAIREANRYLLQFPKGFARAEVEALADSP